MKDRYGRRGIIEKCTAVYREERIKYLNIYDVLYGCSQSCFLIFQADFEQGHWRKRCAKNLVRY